MQDWMAGFPHGVFAGPSVPQARKRRRSFIVGVHVGHVGHVGLQVQEQSLNGLYNSYQYLLGLNSEIHGSS